MGPREGTQQGSIRFGFAVADDDLSFDAAAAQYEGCFYLQNRLVYLCH